MNSSNFDELTKALATSTSRRHALRTIVTASIGGLLGVSTISTAFGRPRARPAPSGPRGNSNCAKFCAAVFGPNTPAANQCTSDAAHNKGLCHDCGTRAPSSICCVRNNPGGPCNGTAGACCSAGCPGCPTGQTCTTTGCCTPDCAGKMCGDDGCGGSCGTCTSPDTCENGQCTCVTPPLPPPGPNLVVCFCNDGSQPSFCTGPLCNTGGCDGACLCHGGHNLATCAASSNFCA
jgi:hypothetical protein